MTRLEEIQNYAQELYPEDKDNDKYNGFIEGALWADSNRCIEHLACEEPTKNNPILCETKNGTKHTLRHCDVIKNYGIWYDFVKSENIKSWRYIGKTHI